MKAISILGSTGSIGCNTLKVVEHLGDVRVVAMAAGRNTEKFVEQIERFSPELVACGDEECAVFLEKAVAKLDKKPRIECGESGLVAVATHPQAETVVSATVGAVGFIPTLRAIEAGKRIALANKETLVMAGELMTAAAASSGAEIVPVDSEHNAIHQCLRGERAGEVRRLILTASGGPFRTWTKERIAAATRKEALDHPNWKMGEKITIDSATLMNKGLEVIEAKWLFGFDADRISVIVHPQSVVHSMIEMIDGSVIAQLGVPDMRHAIQYAITFPVRQEASCGRLDLAAVGKLEFEDPDIERFPCLGLAFEALAAGGTMPAVLNAANEVSVQAFLDGKIGFDHIGETNRRVMREHTPTPADTLAAVLAADTWARERAIMAIGPAAAGTSGKN
ncbi:MAG: 1-deoxy-D-xylulose 5-phosphate reductoisomerase [Acidobacteria bacterium OLB17]|nr:MAG: 1-deoxy-D-xylulose 5-phosphate reductoisomerase [Acidobacteria bacterium OLB17]MCZ2390153.1 1-deoxy-D-xylulose-5-phosphate reductoisomerase [Acidobacteriota bacterium]